MKIEHKFIQINCDRCKKSVEEIQCYDLMVKLPLIETYGGTAKYDLCWECLRDFSDFMGDILLKCELES